MAIIRLCGNHEDSIGLQLPPREAHLEDILERVANLECMLWALEPAKPATPEITALVEGMRAEISCLFHLALDRRVSKNVAKWGVGSGQPIQPEGGK